MIYLKIYIASLILFFFNCSICFSQNNVASDTNKSNILYKGRGAPQGNTTFVIGKRVKIGNNYVSLSLADRIDSLYVPPKTNETGIIVVEVSIDEKGAIINLRAGVRGSTSSNRIMIFDSQEAVKCSKFNAGKGAVKGEITYFF